MRCFAIIFSCLSLLVSLHASDKPLDISQTDIVERTINFIIFVALMWYFLAGRVGKVLTDRTKAISEALFDTQTRIKESREKIEIAKARLNEANNTASEIIKNAKQEAMVAVRHIEEKNKEQIASMIKANEEAMKFHERILQKQLLTEVLDEIFSSSSLEVTPNEYANIISKKVS